MARPFLKTAAAYALANSYRTRHRVNKYEDTYVCVCVSPTAIENGHEETIHHPGRQETRQPTCKELKESARSEQRDNQSVRIRKATPNRDSQFLSVKAKFQPYQGS